MINISIETYQNNYKKARLSHFGQPCFINFAIQYNFYRIYCLMNFTGILSPVFESV